MLLAAPGLLYALGNTHNKDKCPDKNKSTCKPQSDPNQAEDFVFILPAPAKNGFCVEKQAFHHAIVNFYNWYLQNKDKISAGLSGEQKSKDLIPPFNISWQTLHDYFELVQRTYPEWIEGVQPPASAGGGSGNAMPGNNNTGGSINFNIPAK